MVKGDLVDLEVRTWFAEREGWDTKFVEGKVEHITSRAVLIKTADKSEIWIPLSVIKE